MSSHLSQLDAATLELWEPLQRLGVHTCDYRVSEVGTRRKGGGPGVLITIPSSLGTTCQLVYWIDIKRYPSSLPLPLTG